MRRRDCGVGCLTHPALERWASPRRLLAFLCALNLLFFLDRGVVASNGVNGSATDDGTEGLSTTFDLSLFEDGLVAALYFVGVMLGAPIFAVLSKRHTALRLLGWGTALFGGAALLCGFSYFFAMVLVFRYACGRASPCWFGWVCPTASRLHNHTLPHVALQVLGWSRFCLAHCPGPAPRR